MRSSGCLGIVVALLLSSSLASARPLVQKVDPGLLAPAPERTAQIQLPPPIHDQCSGAIAIHCGNIDTTGTTNTATNDYTFPSDAASCTGYKADGRDVVYKIDAAPGDSLWVDYRNLADGSIYLVSNCADVENSCVAGSDKTISPNEIESIRYLFTTGGIYFLILDSFGVNTSGDFTLVGQLLCGPNSPPQNDLCETAIPITCGGFNLSGSTQYANNNYTLPEDETSCTYHAADGHDVVYRLNITAGDSIWVDYTNTADGTMYIVADCDDEVGTCIAGIDHVTGPGQEFLRYKFTFSGVYYLVLDSRGAGTHGFYTAAGALICINPPPVNDLCWDAYDVGYGVIDYSGSTQFATNDYSFINSSQSCTGYYTDGRDVVYRLTVQEGDSLWLDYNSTSDGSVYIVWDCTNLPASCEDGVDIGTSGDTEHLRHKFPYDGIFYLVFDSVDPNSWGLWTAEGELIPRTVGVEDGPRGARAGVTAILPNPFERSTAIAFTLPVTARATLRIYDLQGRVARTLTDERLPAGDHRLVWDGLDDSGAKALPGVYFARLSAAGAQSVRRMIFVR